MSKVLVIANGAAYGNESLFNALRLSITLKEQHPETQLNIFLMSDAVTGALAHQQPKRRLQPPTNVRNFNGTKRPC